LCNSKPGVEHVDAHGLAPPSAADQDPALGGVFDGVGDQVLQQPPQQPPIGTNRERARHEPQLQASVARQWHELDLELAQQVLDAKRRELWLHRAGIEPRNVEQRSDDFLDGLQRSVEIGHERAILALTLALDETGDVKPRGVEGLEDVVAGWQLQDLAKAAVPTDQVEILVVDRDTLADLVERRLQNLAVVLDRRIGVVEQP
jgi:hypothetical protein